MARKQPQQEDAGAYNVQSTHQTEIAMAEMPAMGDATEKGEAPLEAPPPPRFRVERSQYVMQPGGRVILREGKIVDERTYNIDALRSQGVVLTQVS